MTYQMACGEVFYAYNRLYSERVMNQFDDEQEWKYEMRDFPLDVEENEELRIYFQDDVSTMRNSIIDTLSSIARHVSKESLNGVCASLMEVVAKKEGKKLSAKELELAAHYRDYQEKYKNIDIGDEELFVNYSCHRHTAMNLVELIGEIPEYASWL